MDTVNEQATFQHDDVFHRVDFAKKAMALINSHPAERGACVISIDAPWGMGKTTFLHMWINELGRYNTELSPHQLTIFQPHENVCVYYNAWENDYYDNALLPLLYTICGLLSVEKGKTADWEEKKTSKLKNLISAGAGILGFAGCAHSTQNPELAAMVGGLTVSATDFLLHLFEKKELKAISEQYEEDVTNRHEFQKAISELAEVTGRLYVFIDELDRCKPLFAIQTLECIKHFFNIPNVVFIFATDIRQLAYSVAGVYGQGMNAGGYLSKFFDYQLNLPVPDIRDLMKYAYPDISSESCFYEIMNEITAAYILTPRETPVIINQAYIFWKALHLGEKVSPIHGTYCFSYIILLLTIKYKVPDQYADIFQGTYKENINRDNFPTIKKYLSYTKGWVRKTPSELTICIKENAENHMIAIDKSLEYYGKEGAAWLLMINAICNSRDTGSKTIGDVLHATLEIFAIENK